MTLLSALPRATDPSTALIEGNLIKVLAWYDNEWGYSSRVRDLLLYMSKSL